MIKELYIRNPKDPNFKQGVIDHSDPIESIISKVTLIFGTQPGTLLGDLSFGVDLEGLVFTTKINSDKLEQNIKEQFNKYISEITTYDIVPKVSFGKTESYDYAIIDIYINGLKTVGYQIS